MVRSAKVVVRSLLSQLPIPHLRRFGHMFPSRSIWRNIWGKMGAVGEPLRLLLLEKNGMSRRLQLLWAGQVGSYWERETRMKGKRWFRGGEAGGEDLECWFTSVLKGQVNSSSISQGTKIRTFAYCDSKAHTITSTPYSNQVINYNHIMPTRYALELEGLKGAVTNDTFKEPSQREDAKKIVKKLFEERYASGKNRWFFTPLRF